MYNPFSLKGKTIMVTGASSGIGAVIAVECSMMGADVVITGRDKVRLRETFLRLNGSKNKQIIADLTNMEELELLVQEIESLDGIVLSAGINKKSLVKFITAEKIDEIFQMNFYSPALMIRSLIQKRKLNKMASVVFVSSVAASYPAVSNALYAASKGALNSFLKVLALEVASRKIRVNGIQPGLIETGMLKSYDLQEDLLANKKEIPLDGYGTPKDIAYAATYLLSDAARYLTGILLTVDGGMTLR